MFISINEPGVRLYGEVEHPVKLATLTNIIATSMIKKVLRATGNNKSLTSRLLGVKRTTLIDRLHKNALYRRARDGWSKEIKGVAYEIFDKEATLTD